METIIESHPERSAMTAGGGEPGSMSVLFFKKYHYMGIFLISALTILLIVLAVLLLMSLKSSSIPAGPSGIISGRTGISDQAVKTKQMIEEDLEKRAQDILDRLLGPGRAIVTINADVDTEVVKRIRGMEGAGSYLPQDRNDMIPLQETVTEYIQAPGEIKRLSVSVIVDGSYSYGKSGEKVFIPVSHGELDNIESVLKQALGFDEMRDDTIAVTSMPFAKGAKRKFTSVFTENRIYLLAAALFVVLILIVAVLTYSTRKLRAVGKTIGIPASHHVIPDNTAAVEETASPAASETIKNDITGTVDKETSNDAGSGPFASLNHVDTSILSDYLKGEHPQTTAVVLSHLPGKKSAKILAAMPEKIQSEVIFRMANMGVIPKVVIDELDQVLRKDIEAMGAYEGKKLGGVDYVAGIMNHLDINTENIIFASLEDSDPLLADRIRQKMFIFEDILNIDNRGIQTLLKEITNEDLILALKTADDELKERIFSNMSNRAAEMLREDLESLGPVRIADVETAQQSIIRIARKLERLGRLVIAGKGKEDVLV